MSDPNHAWQLHDLPLLDWPSSVLAQRNNPAEHAAVNDSYIIANSPTGEWIDRVNQIATWTSDSTWVFQVPARGRRVFVHSIREYRQFDGRAWVADDPATSLPPGGLTGYVLAKTTDLDFEADWVPGSVIGGGGGGGSAPVVLFPTSEHMGAGYPEGTLGISLGAAFGAYASRGQVYERIGEATWVYRGYISQRGMPEGGTTGQVLAKYSDSDFAAEWVDPEGGAGGDITSVTAGNGLSGGGSGGDVTLAVSWGTTSTTSCVGNDSRLSNDRTASGLRTASGIVAVSSATAPTTGQVLRATSSTTATWQDIEDAIGDGDITAVIAGTGLTGGATSGPATLTVSFGNGSGQACEGNDSRLSNDRVANAIRTTSGTVTVSTSAAPSAGQALIASGPTSASWQDIGAGGSGDITAVVAGDGLTGGATSGSATLAIDFGAGATQVRPGNDASYTNSRSPTGTASGDLGGTYPSPTVVALHTSATQLTIGAIGDGEFLQRSGTTIVGAEGATAPQPTQVNGSLIGTREAIDIVAGTGISISGTDDFSNNRVRVTITAATGDITEVAAGTGLTGGATSGVATLAVDFGTSSSQVRPGNDAAYTNARVPSGSAGGDLGGTYPNPTVTALHSSATQLTVGTIVDGEFLVRSGATIASSAGTSAPQPVQVDGVLVGTRDAIDLVAGTNVTLSGVDDSANNRVRVTINSTGGGGGGGGTFDPNDLDPYIRYNASSASSSGGFVDTMTDLGSAGKNMTASGSNRCAIGTDSNGQLYYDFTGNRIYTAGTTTDWTWMHNNTQQYTVIVVMSKASPNSVASEGILATMNWSSSSRGMFLGHGNNSGTGFDFGINSGAGWSTYAVVNRAAIPYNTGIEVISFVSNRDVRPPAGTTQNMQWSAFAVAGQPASVNGYIGKTLVNRSYVASAAWSTSNAAGTLTLGAMADGNIKLTARIYEIFITRQSLSCYDIHNYATWAADHYEFSLADW